MCKMKKNKRGEVADSTISWIIYLAITIAAAAGLWVIFARL